MNQIRLRYFKNGSKPIPVTGRGGLYGCQNVDNSTVSRQLAGRWRLAALRPPHGKLLMFNIVAG
jgi:hypothetical protein